jgi:SAM-dependent methyltransferase
LRTTSRFLHTCGLQTPKQIELPATEEETAKAVEYAKDVFLAYERMFRERGIPMRGRAYLEIGPGRDLGLQLLMVDRGAIVTVADRFLSQWDEDYHPAFYQALLSRVGGSPSVERVLRQSRYEGVIGLVSAPAEDLRAIPNSTFDIVVSNAVLEHLYDLRAAVTEMHRVSKAGALHTHQVDFRDHRDFARPLEYLLLSRRKFARLAARKSHQFGCQTRPLELVTIFEQAGYSVDEVEINGRAGDAYLDDFIPRLRRAWFSPYKLWNRNDLRAIGVRYWMRT